MSIAVSYTHLDVYKRQTKDSPKGYWMGTQMGAEDEAGQENYGNTMWKKTYQGWMSTHGRPGHMIGLFGGGSAGRPRSILHCSAGYVCV